jgi:hypothetical protein
MRQGRHVFVFVLAQQLEVCEFAEGVSGDMTGVRKPMLNVSTANNNRAGSFIGFSLSAVRSFQKKFSIRRSEVQRIGFIKKSLQRF